MTRRKQPKPIGWYLTDRAYCEDIKTSCNIVSSGVSDVDGSNAWHMWCDGGDSHSSVHWPQEKTCDSRCRVGILSFSARLPYTNYSGRSDFDSKRTGGTEC